MVRSNGSSHYKTSTVTTLQEKYSEVLGTVKVQEKYDEELETFQCQIRCGDEFGRSSI